MNTASQLKLQKFLFNLIVFFAAIMVGGLADLSTGVQHTVLQSERIKSHKINADSQLSLPIGEQSGKAPDRDCLEYRSSDTNNTRRSGGIGSDKSIQGYTKPIGNASNSKHLQILSKPRPGYSSKAKECLVQGKVRLRVTFNADASIGKITPIQRLPHGLTERAVSAARKIKFKPEIRNGIRVAVKKTIAYNFTIY